MQKGYLPGEKCSRSGYFTRQKHCKNAIYQNKPCRRRLLT